MNIGMTLPIWAATQVATYQEFIENLEVLEQYADAFSQISGKDKNELVLNFIRTGVDRYNDGNWKTLAGEEITAFTAYVEEQDSENHTTAMALRDIVVDDFKLPNGNQVDFGHMFGTMNISYLTQVASDDLAGWAGDLCDLMLFSKDYGNVPAGTIDEMADYIRINCFGVDAKDAFGMDDFYGDLDAFYLIAELQKGGKKLSELMKAYFTTDLNDTDRAAYFLNNRFKGLLTKSDVRSAILGAYTANTGLKVLEADRGLTGETDLRTATCYAFADYLFNCADGHLTGGGVEDEESNAYYTVFSSTASTLAPGISQTINYATTADNKQIVYYVATVDVTRDDVTIMANYKDNDPSKGWGTQRVEDQVKALVNNYKDKYEYFTPVVATNGDGYNMSTGEPGGLLVMDGKEWKGVDKDGFFAILKDGTAMIGTQADYAIYKDQIKEAIGGFGAVLVKDGEIATTNNSGRASRTAIGITAKGEVIMMVLDGRQEPFSAGGSMAEIAQIMLDAGCVHAINLDGGGSTTYLSKPEGSDDLTLVNRPSDGYARSVAVSLVAISTAKSSKEFDHANITSDYDYLTIGTSLNMAANGVSNTGYSAPVPEGAVWQVSNEAIGSITADGVFTAIANGEVEVQLIVNGKVVGSKTLYVVVPDAIKVEGGNVTAIFGKPAKIPVVATYMGKTVAINENDVLFGAVEETAGVFDGFTFIGDESVGIRNVTAAVIVIAVDDVGVMFNINLYYEDEAYFDFDNATAGNRTLAWLREVNNAKTSDGMLYQIADPNQSMGVDYTFALDLSEVAIPDKLADLTHMLPGADTGATAWHFMLQLAERISVLTEVRITAQIDTDLDVDISGLKVSNEYFYLKSATIDENNVLTMICGWYDQTAAIDPATANSICILSGLKATPKADAAWDGDDQLIIKNTGKVSYKIYLRANALYSFSSQPANQAQYGLYPFENKDVIIGGATEKGAYFASEYADFEDSFILDKTILHGWQTVDKDLYYYVDHVPVTGIQKLPSYDNPSVSLYYEFDENGVCLGALTGLVEESGKLYYSVAGKLVTGWHSILDAETGESAFYYFHPYRGGAAVTGTNVNCDGFYMTFVDYKLVRGDLRKTAGGWQYRYADGWLRNQWIELDGNYYFIGRDFYLKTGGIVAARNLEGTANEYHLFDDNGVWLKDVNGVYEVDGKLYFFENGKMISRNMGLVKVDGDYYYFRTDGTAVCGRTYWITNTNDLLPQSLYEFDENGKMINPPAEGGSGSEGGTGGSGTPGLLNGIVEEGGKWYYYENGKRAYKGLMQMADGTYIYVRSTGELATGKYWPTKNNDLLPLAVYDFGEYGRLTYVPTTPDTPDTPDTPVTPPVTPTVKNGVVEENGAYFYYENGIRKYKGLMEMTDEDGAVYYIYVRSTGQLATGKYWPTLDNGVLPVKTYDFGTNGRLYLNVEAPDTPDTPDTPVVPDEPQGITGVVSEGGKLYYYENGKRAYKGLMEMTDENGAVYYIYVRSTGQLAIGKYWVTKHNDVLPEAHYVFDENGRLYL
jgi:glucan-binding YG repeat protein